MKIYFPEIFSGHKEITAFFTEANRNEVNQNGTIPGLNLGYNTTAEKIEIDDNFRKLEMELGLLNQSYTLTEQVHGSDIKVVDQPGIIEGFDGLITKESGLAIGIRVADCAAILIADPHNRVIGAFHAGWKGAARGIVSKGLDKMKKEGGDPSGFLVYGSPCISQKNFEVGEEVAKEFPDQFVDRIQYPKPHVDLKGFLMNQLLAGGVMEKNIEFSNECTMQEKRFFSYRREREEAGRMLAMIKLNP
jgi:polyphenol oxidase